MIARLMIAALTVLALSVCNLAHGQNPPPDYAISYIFSGIGTLTTSTQTLNNVQYSLEIDGDTRLIATNLNPDLSVHFYSSVIEGAAVNIAGYGHGYTTYNSWINMFPGTGLIGLRDYNNNGIEGVSDALIGYDFKHSIGPVTMMTGASNQLVADGQPIQTQLGALLPGSTFTFQAILGDTISSVPECNSLVAALIGLIPIGLLCLCQRKATQRAPDQCL
jgi:hypothetical protein